VELCRDGRELEPALRSNVGQITLRLALVDVLAVEVEAETKIVSAAGPAQVSCVVVGGVTVAMRLKIISGPELRKTIDQNERPALLRLPVGLKAGNFHERPAQVLISPRRHIVEVLPKVTVVAVDDEIRAGHVCRRNRPLEKVALYETGAGIRAADGQTTEGTKAAAGVRVMIHETEAHESTQLRRGILSELGVVLPAPLVVGRRGH